MSWIFWSKLCRERNSQGISYLCMTFVILLIMWFGGFCAPNLSFMNSVARLSSYPLTVGQVFLLQWSSSYSKKSCSSSKDIWSSFSFSKSSNRDSTFSRGRLSYFWKYGMISSINRWPSSVGSKFSNISLTRLVIFYCSLELRIGIFDWIGNGTETVF